MDIDISIYSQAYMPSWSGGSTCTTVESKCQVTCCYHQYHSCFTLATEWFVSCKDVCEARDVKKFQKGNENRSHPHLGLLLRCGPSNVWYSNLNQGRERNGDVLLILAAFNCKIMSQRDWSTLLSFFLIAVACQKLVQHNTKGIDVSGKTVLTSADRRWQRV